MCEEMKPWINKNKCQLHIRINYMKDIVIKKNLITKEIMWARSLMKSLGYPRDEPTILYEDNMSTIAMIKNKCNGKRTKHIEVRYNLIREQVQKLVIEMRHLPTKEMTSDMLSKALAPGPFIHLRNKILGMATRIRPSRFVGGMLVVI
jgi:hypothetical protein